jgi:hypothetical protein
MRKKLQTSLMEHRLWKKECSLGLKDAREKDAGVVGPTDFIV